MLSVRNLPDVRTLTHMYADKQREGLQQTMSRAFETTGQDDVLISHVALTSDDASLCSGTLPAFLVMRYMFCGCFPGLETTEMRPSCPRTSKAADVIRAFTRTRTLEYRLLDQTKHESAQGNNNSADAIARTRSQMVP